MYQFHTTLATAFVHAHEEKLADVGFYGSYHQLYAIDYYCMTSNQLINISQPEWSTSGQYLFLVLPGNNREIPLD